MDEKKLTVTREELRKAVENLKLSYQRMKEAVYEETISEERFNYAYRCFFDDRAALNRLLNRIGIHTLACSVEILPAATDSMACYSQFVVKMEYIFE